MGGMKFFLKTLTGKKIQIELAPTDTVLALLEEIEKKEGISPSKTRLIHMGRALAHHKTLQEYNITEGSIVHLVLALH
uniref:Ubiquitin-like domain-containing protein n=1 Tax=Arcella intermedia TaxID=1963864 RepID=A0A6B2LW52_9EUKA